MVKFILSSIMSNTTLNLVAIFKTPKPCKNICYKFLISKLLANSFEFDAGIGPLNGWFFYGSLSPWTKYTMHIQHFDEMTNIVSHGEEQCVNVSCDSKITACTDFFFKIVPKVFDKYQIWPHYTVCLISIIYTFDYLVFRHDLSFATRRSHTVNILNSKIEILRFPI